MNYENRKKKQEYLFVHVENSYYLPMQNYLPYIVDYASHFLNNFISATNFTFIINLFTL